MPRFRFVQVDVFTDKKFAGNPLAVFPDAAGIDEKLMQKIANEMNLSETVFVLPARDERALRRLRIFTPRTELPLAGHPVVGAWNVLARAEYGAVVAPPASGGGSVRIEQELGVGVLPVEIEFSERVPSGVVMTQAAFVAGVTITEAEERAEIARSLGLQLEDLDDRLPIQTIATGIPTLAVPVRSLERLGECQIESTRLAAAYMRADAFTLYAFTTETREGELSAAHARLFAPDTGIAEDPATGSAAGSLGGYLMHHGALAAKHQTASGTHKFIIEQGDFMQRPSRIEVEVAGAAGAVGAVKVGGKSVVVLEGELML